MHVDLHLLRFVKEILSAFFVGVKVDEFTTIENIAQVNNGFNLTLFQFGEKLLCVKFLKEVVERYRIGSRTKMRISNQCNFHKLPMLRNTSLAFLA